MSMIWPIALIVFSNVVYQICAKEIPKDMDTMASMTITYLTGAICSAVIFFVTNRGGNLLHEYSKTNSAPFLLGVSVVGFIYAYKNGWQVNSVSVVQSAFLSIALLIVGALLYHEVISVSKVIGVILCLAGLVFMNK